MNANRNKKPHVFGHALIALLYLSFTLRAQTTKPAALPQDARNPVPALWESRDHKIGFLKFHGQFLDRIKQGNVQLVFFGDSITEFWPKKDFAVRYGKYDGVNFGIRGDRTQHVLWRVANGEMDGIQPKVAVLLIGTNNMSTNPAEQIAEAIGNIVQLIRDKSPVTKVMVLGILPRDWAHKDGAVQPKIARINELIAKLDDGKHVRFLDLANKFKNADGTLKEGLFKDRLHPNDAGYAVLAEAINPLLVEMGGGSISSDSQVGKPAR